MDEKKEIIILGVNPGCGYDERVSIAFVCTIRVDSWG